MVLLADGRRKSKSRYNEDVQAKSQRGEDIKYDQNFDAIDFIAVDASSMEDGERKGFASGHNRGIDDMAKRYICTDIRYGSGGDGAA